MRPAQWWRPDTRTRAGDGRTEANGPRGGGLEARCGAFDRNGDGRLTPGEFPRAETLKQVDRRQDAVVTFDEVSDCSRGARQRRGADRRHPGRSGPRRRGWEPGMSRHAGANGGQGGGGMRHFPQGADGVGHCPKTRGFVQPGNAENRGGGYTDVSINAPDASPVLYIPVGVSPSGSLTSGTYLSVSSMGRLSRSCPNDHKSPSSSPKAHAPVERSRSAVRRESPQVCHTGQSALWRRLDQPANASK